MNRPRLGQHASRSRTHASRSRTPCADRGVSSPMLRIAPSQPRPQPLLPVPAMPPAVAPCPAAPAVSPTVVHHDPTLSASTSLQGRARSVPVVRQQADSNTRSRSAPSYRRGNAGRIPPADQQILLVRCQCGRYVVRPFVICGCGRRVFPDGSVRKAPTEFFAVDDVGCPVLGDDSGISEAISDAPNDACTDTSHELQVLRPVATPQQAKGSARSAAGPADQNVRSKRQKSVHQALCNPNKFRILMYSAGLQWGKAFRQELGVATTVWSEPLTEDIDDNTWIFLSSFLIWKSWEQSCDRTLFLPALGRSAFLQPTMHLSGSGQSPRLLMKRRISKLESEVQDADRRLHQLRGRLEALNLGSPEQFSSTSEGIKSLKDHLACLARTWRHDSSEDPWLSTSRIVEERGDIKEELADISGPLRVLVSLQERYLKHVTEKRREIEEEKGTLACKMGDPMQQPGCSNLQTLLAVR